MTKQELTQAAKEIRDICKEYDEKDSCDICPFSIRFTDVYDCCLRLFPCDWDIERLERESNES